MIYIGCILRNMTSELLELPDDIKEKAYAVIDNFE